MYHDRGTKGRRASTRKPRYALRARTFPSASGRDSRAAENNYRGNFSGIAGAAVRARI